MKANAEAFWFRRGRTGLGHWPQTWQGWACVGGFMALLVGSVLILESVLSAHAQGQAIVLVIAAVEIMGFMRFVRKRSQGPDADGRNT